MQQRRGEVWLVRLDPTIGAEIGKTRPVVVVSADNIGVLPLKVIVPITSWQERFHDLPWMIRLEPTRENGLLNVSAADAFQISSVSAQRFIRQLGQISDVEIEKIAEVLSLVLDIKS